MKRSILISTMCALLIVCVGCGGGMSESNSTSGSIQVSDIFSVEVQTGDPYGLFAKKDTRTKESYTEGVQALFEGCMNQPEVLASTLSAFPTAAHECGMESANPAAIDNSMDCAEGGEIQRTLLDKLEELLTDPKTEFRYSKWSGKANMLFMMERYGEEVYTPETMMLFWDAVTVSGHGMLAIAVTYENGDTEYGYFDLVGGFQRFVPISDDKPASFIYPS